MKYQLPRFMGSAVHYLTFLCDDLCSQNYSSDTVSGIMTQKSKITGIIKITATFKFNQLGKQLYP